MLGAGRFETSRCIHVTAPLSALGAAELQSPVLFAGIMGSNMILYGNWFLRRLLLSMCLLLLANRPPLLMTPLPMMLPRLAG